MVTNTCPACGGPIAVGDINVSEGVALCRSCGKLSRLTDLVDEPTTDATTLAAPPAGCSYDEPAVGEAHLRATLRSPGGAVGILLFALFWNGIVSIFVLLALSGLYTHFVGPLPKWFPAPGSSGSSGKRGSLGPGMPLGETLFLCVFLIPFVLVGLGTILGFLNAVFGRVDVFINGPDGRVRTGFGPIAWTRRFDASAVTRVVVGETSYSQNGERKRLIRIEADQTVKFGSMLSDQRRTWMIGALHVLLVTRTKGRRATPARVPLVRS